MTYRKTPIIKPPWGGWNDSVPAALLNANSFKQITNWMIRFNRLTPFFATSEWFIDPSLNGQVLMAGRTYTDQQGFNHTIFLTDKGWAELVPGSPNYSITLHTWPAAYPPYTDANLFELVVYNNQLFFDNGIIPLTFHKGDGNMYADGPVVPSVPGLNPVGDFPGACSFLGAFADRLLAINTTEPFPGIAGSTNYPNRIRYSAVNNAQEWDFTVDASAGSFLISDAEDALTGWVVINQTGFAFRKNGITAINSTGNQTIPFFVENFSVGPAGVGCFVPHTLSAYGTTACFVSQDDIYTFSGGQPQQIGTNAKRSIFKDLNNASSTVFGQMVGSFGQFVDYLTYWLIIPQSPTVSSVWIYHFDEGSWVNSQQPYGDLRCLPLVATA